MIVRFLAPNGSPQRALDYVLSSHDEWGRERDVTLVAGSPTAFLAATRDLVFTRPYQSCVLAWSAGDSPSARQLDQVLDCLVNAMAEPVIIFVCEAYHDQQEHVCQARRSCRPSCRPSPLS